MGIATAFSGVGAAIFTPILSNLIVSVGWQTSYLLAGGMSLVLTVPFTAFVLKFKPADMGMTPYGAEEGKKVAAVASEMQVGMSVKRAWATGLVAFVFVMIGVLMVIFNCGNNVLLFVGATLYGVSFSVQTVMLPLVCTKMFGKKDFPRSSRTPRWEPRRSDLWASPPTVPSSI